MSFYNKYYSILFFGLCFFYSCTVKNVKTVGTQDSSIHQYVKKDSLSQQDNTLEKLRGAKLFKDPLLVALIDTALLNNQDLKIALTRIQTAKADVLRTNAPLLPSVEAGSSLGFKKYGRFTEEGVGNFDTNFSENISDNQNIPYPVTPNYALGLNTYWELDVWKKLRTEKKAALKNLSASEEVKNFMVTQLVANVADLYYQLVEKDIELSIAHKNIELQEKQLEIITIQKVAGRVTELAVKQFKAQLLHSQSFEYTVRQEIYELENRLNVILGRLPNHPIKRNREAFESSLPEIPNEGISSQVLLQRPDVVAAEHQLAASKADVYAARAAFYPSLSLTPSLGFQAFRARLLFDPRSIAFGAFANIAAPIFNRKKLIANSDKANAQNYAMLYQYEKTILNAMSETLVSLKGIENSAATYDLKSKQVDELTKAVSVSNTLFLEGYASYLEVVTAQGAVFEAELEQVKVRNAQFMYHLNLYKALGGGWK